MDETQQIAARLQALPPSLQREALDFIEFLAQRDGEDAAWGDFSLAQAMEGLEDEDAPEYSEADLKERWR